ncbi:ComF family protein [Radicibacter daui]|uniref:ComF family protein n=1 Tax=Radicibacter daui TaxID=3064829 RepID=UPI004046DFE5
MQFTLPRPRFESLRRDLQLLRRFGQLVLDTVLPPRCLACRQTVAEPGALCATCWSGLSFISAPLCPRCGAPQEMAGTGALPCNCARRRYAQARAAVLYDDASRPLVTALKFADRTALADLFGRWLQAAGAEMLADADLLVPVPLHRWRLLWRRYNQSALVATALSRRSGVQLLPDALLRPRRTRPQPGLTRAARRRNVRGAFAINERHRLRLAGCRIVLVDDVLTSGATLEECARVLLAAGAVEVRALTVARVADPA